MDLSLSFYFFLRLRSYICLNMRIRKNAKLSPSWFSHASAPEALQTHVCQLNQSPWDAIPFAQDSSQVSPPQSFSHFLLQICPKPSLRLPPFLHFSLGFSSLPSSQHLGFPKTLNSFTFIVYLPPNSRLG